MRLLLCVLVAAAWAAASASVVVGVDVATVWASAGVAEADPNSEPMMMPALTRPAAI
jgi:hypothetical protein